MPTVTANLSLPHLGSCASCGADKTTLLSGLRQVLHCCLDAALGILDPAKIQPHLHAGESADQAQPIQVTKMADPEHLVGDLAQAVAERHIEVFENYLTQGVSTFAFRHHHGGQHTAIFQRFFTEYIKPPGPDCSSRCFTK